MSNMLNEELTMQSIVNDMKIGWNLGNSLESPSPEKSDASLADYETSWGNPVTTRKMILEVIKAGFNTIRIPVTWGKLMHIGPEYRINDKWLNRVQEVVDYAYNEGVYVIIDIHHEDDWLFLGDKKAETKAMKILNNLWVQIAERFKTYDYHLIFETMNETRLIGSIDEWTIGTIESRITINKFNEIAVNAIRSTGQMNITRPLIIKTIGARYNAEAIKDIVIPNNDSRIILSVHAYVPYYFCMVPEKTDFWGNNKDREELSKLIAAISEAAKEKGIPVIIGEFGTIDKNNENIRAEYAAFFVSEAKKRGITCVLWDNNIASNKTNAFTYSIFNRDELSWRFPKILRALIDNA